MFTDKQLENYTRVMIWALEKARGKRYKKGEVIRLAFDLSAMELSEAIHKHLVKEGRHVIVKPIMNETMEYDLYKFANNKQLKYVGPWEDKFFNSLNGSIYLSAPASLIHLKDIDPKKMGKAAVARKHLKNILEEREQKKLFGWTLCMYPTEALAEKAGIDIYEYARQIEKACYLNEDDAVAKWSEVMANAQKARKWLDSILKDTKYLHVESDNMDIKIVPGEKRQWVGPSGHNIPGFEIFLSPDCRYTEGVYYANLPSYRSGNFVEKIRIVFKNGKATDISAESGEEFTRKMAAMDDGACKVGEFSLTDKRFSPIDTFMADILYDENFGGDYGNCHLALGNSYSQTYDGNQSSLTKELKKELGFNSSALHWDLINTEDKVVTAHFKNGDSKIIYEKGMFSYI